MADRKRSLNGKPRGQHPANALSIAFARSVSRPGRYCDGNALYLQVKPSGARSWVQRMVIRGRRRELGLGGFPLVSLTEARAVAHTNRKMARTGGDPLAERRRAAGMPTFAEAAERVWADKNPGWRHPRHAREWLSSLERHVFPRIGQLAVRGRHERRRARGAARGLAHAARDRTAAAPAHQRRDGVGRGDGVPGG